MNRTTNAILSRLSQETKHPSDAFMAMRNLFISNSKLNKANSQIILLRRLSEKRVGTRSVEIMNQTLARERRRSAPDYSFIMFAMRKKIQDAEWYERQARAQFYRDKEVYRNTIRQDSLIDHVFLDTMDMEMNNLWSAQREKNSRKVSHLLNKWRTETPETQSSDTRGVLYRDSELNVPVDDKNKEAVLYGGVEISEEESEIIRNNPKLHLYEQINSVDMEIQIQRGILKNKYSLMSVNMKDDEDEGDGSDEDEDALHKDTLNLESKTIDYSMRRATDIPTCTRLLEPAKAKPSQEAVLLNLKDDLMKVVHNYREEHTKDGLPRSNLSKDETKGLRKIKARIKNQEVVCFSTDKSGKMSLDSTQNYQEAIRVHTTSDPIIDTKTLDSFENILNDHMMHFNKMFSIGSGTSNGNRYRITLASKSTNVAPPSLYGLRKDHKVIPEGSSGPPLRPVCSAKISPNSRLGNALSKVIYDLSDSLSQTSEVKSSEEMRAGFATVNSLEENNRKNIHVLSMDVKSLYPSIRVSVAKKAMKWLVMRSEMDMMNLNFTEMTRYLAVNMSPEELESEGLTSCIPGRLKISRRKLTMNSLKDKNADILWLKAAPPTDHQKKVILGNVLAIAAEVIMTHHTYIEGDKVHHQQTGAPIGLEAAGAIARAVMLMFDELYLLRLIVEKIKIIMYRRYVDDSNQGVSIEDNEEIKTVAAKMKSIADDILEGIVMEVDLCDNYPDRKLPILDMKVFVENNLIVYQHYEKSVSSKLVIPARSAHSAKTKRSVHISECVRRMMNISPLLTWSQYAAPVLTEYMSRMMAAGYGEDYRKEVLLNAISIYDSKRRNDEDGTCPLNRPPEYQKVERRKAKFERKKSWASTGGYTSVIIVPATPGGTLAKQMRAVCDRGATKNIKIRIVERGGKTLLRQLQRSNPTAPPKCFRSDCAACEQEDTFLRCHKDSVTYRYTCLQPSCDAAYQGETGRNFYTRGKDHQDLYESEKQRESKSWMFAHQQQAHSGDPAQFKIKILNHYKDPLSRMAAESVHIARHQAEYGDEATLNSKAEYHQAPITRLVKQVRYGL